MQNSQACEHTRQGPPGRGGKAKGKSSKARQDEAKWKAVQAGPRGWGVPRLASPGGLASPVQAGSGQVRSG